MTFAGAPGEMRLLLPLLLLGSSLLAAPDAREVASLLLSPDEKKRERGRREWRDAKPDRRRELLRHLQQWDFDRGRWIRALDARVAKAVGEERARLERLLANLADPSAAGLRLEVLGASVPRAAARKLLGEPLDAIRIHADADAVRERILGADGAKVLIDEREPLAEHRRTTVERTERISFVEDFDVQVGQGTFIADPVIGILQHGAVADLRAALVDGDLLVVRGSLLAADLELPIPAVEKQIDGAPKRVVVQTPNLRAGEREIRTAIPPGHAAVVAVPLTGGRTCLFWIRAAKR